jgi:glyoxylase I family protein
MTIDIRGIAPLLQVYDMPASLAFYCGILGFALEQSNSTSPPYDWVLLRRGDAELMLNTMYEAEHRPAAPDAARTAAHRDVHLFFFAADVDAVYAHLTQRGVAADAPTVAPYGMKQLWASDPDGYGLCFQCPVSHA